VNFVRKACCWLFLALWLPVTMHCMLEAWPGLGFLICCQHQDSAPHQDSDCSQDSCATVESGAYKVEDHPALGALPLTLLAVVALDKLVEQPLPEAPGSVPAFVPPELARTWQFSCRTARLPRAPSVIS
jgi:hypothetical protein